MLLQVSLLLGSRFHMVFGIVNLTTASTGGSDHGNTSVAVNQVYHGESTQQRKL